MTDNKVKGVSIVLVVLPFEEPATVEKVLEDTVKIADAVAVMNVPGIAIVRTATSPPDATKEELGDLLLMVGNLAVRAACDRMKIDYGWLDAWVKALNDEMLAALEGEGGIH